MANNSFQFSNDKKRASEVNSDARFLSFTKQAGQSLLLEAQNFQYCFSHYTLLRGKTQSR
jgi:hypothetical protein